MAYSRFSTKFRRRGFKKVAVGRKPKRTYAPKKKYPMVSFAKRVNALISAKIENKMSNNLQVSGNVSTWASGTSPVWFKESLLGPMSMTQGTSSWNRIGNTITLKKWIVKVLVHPTLDNDPYASTGFQFNRFTHQGKVTLFIMKLKNGGFPFPTLNGLLQNGNAETTPTGILTDQLCSINTDKYKIYYKRSFRVGSSQTGEVIPNTGGIGQGYSTPYPLLSNNDLKISAGFSVDLCKYIGKNAKITFDDNTVTPNLPASLTGIALCAIWSPIAGNMTVSSGTPNSCYQVLFNNHIEFEDA